MYGYVYTLQNLDRSPGVIQHKEKRLAAVARDRQPDTTPGWETAGGRAIQANKQNTYHK